jgi:hypothetical protein
MISALKLGDFSIYNEGSLQNLSSYQDNATGAFYGEEHYNDSVLLNTNHSSMAGLFCLMAGMSRRALMVGDFVLNHIKQQPHINDRFYIHTDSKGQLITDFSEEDSFWYAIDYSQPSGHYWAIGTGAYFLTELFLYTRREKYLKGARILLDLCKRLPGGFETWPSSGKVAWAAAKMYSVTRDEDYIKLATSVGQGCLIESQRSDGSWGPFAFSMGKGGGYHLSVPELTAEFSLLCGAIALDV